MTLQRINPGPRMSEAVIHGQTVYLRGLTAEPPSGNVVEQTQRILERIDELLAEVGSDKTRLLSANIWLADMRHFDEMNTVWVAWVPKGCAPARATVEAKLAGPEYLVEIMVQASTGR